MANKKKMNYKCVYNDNIRILSVNAEKQQTTKNRTRNWSQTEKSIPTNTGRKTKQISKWKKLTFLVSRSIALKHGKYAKLCSHCLCSQNWIEIISILAKKSFSKLKTSLFSSMNTMISKLERLDEREWRRGSGIDKRKISRKVKMDFSFHHWIHCSTWKAEKKSKCNKHSCIR